MTVQGFTPLTSIIVGLLLVGAGFCLIGQVKNVAARLLVWGFVIAVSPLFALVLLGGVNAWATIHFPKISWLVLVLGGLFVAATAWIAFRWKLIRVTQCWLIPRVGREVDGYVTGERVSRLLGFLKTLLKFFAGATLMLLLFYASR